MYTFLSEPSLPRLLKFRILPLLQTDSGTGGTDDHTIFEQFVDWYIGFNILLKLLSNFNFRRKVRTPTSVFVSWSLIAVRTYSLQFNVLGYGITLTF